MPPLVQSLPPCSLSILYFELYSSFFCIFPHRYCCTLPKTSKVKTRVISPLDGNEVTLFAARFIASSSFILTTTVHSSRDFPLTLCMLSSLSIPRWWRLQDYQFCNFETRKGKNEHQAITTTKQVEYPFAIHLPHVGNVNIARAKKFPTTVGYRKHLVVELKAWLWCSDCNNNKSM